MLTILSDWVGSLSFRRAARASIILASISAALTLAAASLAICISSMPRLSNIDRNCSMVLNSSNWSAPSPDVSKVFMREATRFSLSSIFSSLSNPVFSSSKLISPSRFVSNFVKIRCVTSACFASRSLSSAAASARSREAWASSCATSGSSSSASTSTSGPASGEERRGVIRLECNGAKGRAVQGRGREIEGRVAKASEVSGAAISVATTRQVDFMVDGIVILISFTFFMYG
mmetsp:Transcript_3808/g.7101  ORF Transcript_3808/g.7101 Transcript_3808/m.7101 type:complete len:232 (+) Transcript_3808:569-1264(+)